MKKRTLSLLLCIVLMLSLLPTVAFAQDKLPAPDNLRWDGTVARWNPVDGAEKYGVKVYIHPESSPAMAAVVETTACEYDFAAFFATIKTEEKFAFKVLAYADGIYGDESPFSETKELTMPATLTSITDVSIEGLKVPEVGTTLSEFLSTVKVPADADYSIMDRSCFIKGSGARMTPGQAFEAGVEYYFGAVIYPDTGYMFTASTAVSTADIAKGSQTVEANAEMGGMTVLTVETECFTPTEPAACEVARIDLTVDEPALGMTHLKMFESLSLVAYDKDGNVVEEIGIGGYDAFSYATFALSAWDFWDDAIADASKYYGLSLHISTIVGVTIAGDVQVTVNGSSSSILRVDIWDDANRHGSVYFAMPVKPTTFTISYNLNGGTMDGKTGTVTVDVKEGTVITLPAPTKEGFVFDYWEGSKYNAGDTYTVTGDHTFTAQWKEPEPTTGTITIGKSFVDIPDDDKPINQATFTVTSSDGSYNRTAKVGDREFSATPAFGQFVWQLKDVPAGTYTVTETAYDVDGYSCTVTYTVGRGEEQEGDTATASLRAGDDLAIIFVDTYVEEVTVTFEMNGHGTQVEAQTFESGEKAAKPTDPTAAGFVFGGWYADEKLSKKFDFNTAITEDTVVYAKWTSTKNPGAVATGDDSNIPLWAAIVLMSGAAFVGAAVYGKKKIFGEK